MENFVPYELEDIFFGWKSQTAFRSSRNHLETSTQSAYKRKTMNSNQNEPRAATKEVKKVKGVMRREI